TLRIALAQTNQIMGDLSANAQGMLAWRAQAAAEGADLIIFPELQLIGYPTEDLVLKPALVERAEAELVRLAEATGDGGPAMLVGTVIEAGGTLYNCAALLDGGAIIAVSQKRELPNYGTFDEKRLFTPGPLPEPVEFRGVRLGLPVGEDMWTPTIAAHLKERGAQILIAINGSPYEVAKDTLRRNGVCAARVEETGLPIVYINRVGGQDELVFDGASFVMDATGEIVTRLPEWEEVLFVTEWRQGEDGTWACQPGPVVEVRDQPEEIYGAMLTGLRDYVERNGFPGVVLGLSGGIDSALSAAVAVDALGPDRVWCVSIPSDLTSTESLEDAAECARMLGVRYDTIPIGPAIDSVEAMLARTFAARAATDQAQQNIHSRIRATTLMALSDAHGVMLLATGNKTELSVGYGTLYGDMAGSYGVLKDVYKTTVFDLALWRNQHRPTIGHGADGPVMPQRVIDRPPSAEVREAASHKDGLPPHSVLDPILYGLVEQEKSVDDLVAIGFDRDMVVRIEERLYGAEHKRRQSPPGVKLGARNFGRDRRYPISNAFRTA
ncbi:MAG: NAD+ synthase, partial [Sphingobium sp.]